MKSAFGGLVLGSLREGQNRSAASFIITHSSSSILHFAFIIDHRSPGADPYRNEIRYADEICPWQMKSPHGIAVLR